MRVRQQRQANLGFFGGVQHECEGMGQRKTHLKWPN